MHLLSVQIAGVHLLVTVPEQLRVAPWLTSWAATASGPRDGAFPVEVVRRAGPAPAASTAVPEISVLGGGRCALRGSGFAAELSADGARIEQVDSPAPLELLLKLVVADALRRRGGLLVHSVALARGRAAVFVGPSGAGKSTLGALGVGVGLSRLADELVAVVPEPGGFVARGTPWNVGVNDARPLAFLASMSHAPGNRLGQEDESAFLRLLLGNVLSADPSPQGRHETFRIASALVERVPVRHLAFAKEAAAAELVASHLE